MTTLKQLTIEQQLVSAFAYKRVQRLMTDWVWRDSLRNAIISNHQVGYAEKSLEARKLLFQLICAEPER